MKTNSGKISELLKTKQQTCENFRRNLGAKTNCYFANFPGPGSVQRIPGDADQQAMISKPTARRDTNGLPRTVLASAIGSKMRQRSKSGSPAALPFFGEALPLDLRLSPIRLNFEICASNANCDSENASFDE